MPKPFDKSSLGFSSGYTGSTDSSNVFYKVDGNVITGELNRTLSKGEALTVRLTLPEGYFTAPRGPLIVDETAIRIYSILIIGISLIFVLISDRLWAKYGKDNQVVETVEFYPPEGYNSAEIGVMYNGTADTPSVISLLIYLANKGYLKIEEVKKKDKKGADDVKIIKLKEYDGDNENEKLFFEGLFKNANHSFDEENEFVTLSDLMNKFFITVNKIKMNLNKNKNKNKLFESSASKKSKWLIIIIILIFVLITLQPTIKYENLKTALLALCLPSLGFSALFWLLFGKASAFKKICGFIYIIAFDLISWGVLVFPALITAFSLMPLLVYTIGIICVAIIIMFLRIMPKRTDFGNEMLGKLKGFRRFLETAEKPQLESLVSENPEYFYNILPYTYALGVSKVWISQFETIAIQAPNWYNSDENFNMQMFGIFIAKAMSDASIIMGNFIPTGGSLSSGGGVAGGGSGGGGGGSW